jgi:hypothetical protein
MDEVYTAKNKFYEACRNKINERSLIEAASAAIEGTIYLELTIDDMGTDRWTEQFLKTFDPCFNTSVFPPFTAVDRKLKFNPNIYFMSTNKCPENCNKNGLCTLGRCTCKNGWHSLACNQRNCYNSLVFIDIDIIDP